MGGILQQRFFRALVPTVWLSLFTQFLGMLRQVVVAASFGLSRDLDYFWVAFAIVSLLVITSGFVFESVAVPFLVAEREEGRGDEARSGVFWLSILVGGGLSLVLLVGGYFLIDIFAAGFHEDGKKQVLALLWWFAPVGLVFLPYSALAAGYKSSWRFFRVFLVEALLTGSAVLFIFLWKDDIRALPLSYVFSYALGVALLLPGARVFHRQKSDTWPLLKKFFHVGLANHCGSIPSVIDRYFQSLLLPGGISLLSYVGQLVNGLSSFLSFREVFIVPLAETEERGRKLERLLSATLLIAIPLVGALELSAREILGLWLQRGNFDHNAVVAAISVLQVYALVLIPSSLAAPMFRIFQITNRMRYVYIGYGSSALFIGIGGLLFVMGLGWDVRGMAWALFLNSLLMCILAAVLMRSCEVVVHWGGVLRFFLIAATTTVLGYFVGSGLLSWLVGNGGVNSAWARLGVAQLAFAAVIALGYLFFRKRLISLLR